MDDSWRRKRERERKMGDLMLFWVSWWGRERKVANGGERGGEREGKNEGKGL
jgi:hypothetical protein